MSESRFVGRTAQINQIEQHIVHCLSGQPRVLFVQGLAGIGKTRFLEEVKGIALHQGMEVYAGRCDETLTQPYAPFIALLPRFEYEGVLDKSDITLLHRFFGASVSVRPTPTLGEAKDDKIQLLIALAQGLIRLAHQQPMLIMVEDLHMADQLSVDALSYLAFALAEQRTVPLFLVGSYRPVAPKTSLGHVLSQLQPEAVVHDLELTGLEESETRELLQSLGVARPTQQMVSAVHNVTHGIPLFIEQAVHHAVSTGALYAQGGYLLVRQSAMKTWRLPQTISDVLADRIASLPDDCLDGLTLASLLGDSFSVDHLVLLGQDDLAMINATLEAGIEHGIVVRDHDHFRFAHTLIRHAFSMRLDSEQRQQTHLQIAQAFARLYRDNLGSHTLDIAHHLIEAGSLVEARMLNTYAKAAGDQAHALFAWSDSVRYYEAALRAAEALADSSLQEKAELYLHAGSAHYGNHDVGPALDRFAKATAYYRELEDVSGLAKSLIWLVRLHNMYRTSMGELSPHVEELETLIDADGAIDLSLRGYSMALLAQGFRHARQPERATQLAQNALATGHLVHDDRLCAQAANSLGLVYLSRLQVERAIASWQEALGFARAANDLTLQVLPLTNLPLALNLKGALEEGELTALEDANLTKTIQDWAEYSKVLSHLASVAVARGNFAAAEQYVGDAMVMMERSHYPWGGYRALHALAYALAIRGVWDEANQALDTVSAPGRVFVAPNRIIQVFVRIFRQLILGYRSQQLTEYVAPLHDELMAVVTNDTYALAPLCAMIELGELTLNPAVTEQPAEMLAQALDRGVVFSSGWCFLIPRVLGVAAVMHENWRQAERHFQHAMAIGSYVNAVPELARTYLDYARMMMIRPDRRERYGAAEFLERAKGMFHELNMLPHATLAFQYTELLFGARIWSENPDSILTEQIPKPPSINGTHSTGKI